MNKYCDESIDAMISAFGIDMVINFCKCNAFKYLWKYTNTNDEENLHKMNWYIDKQLKLQQ